MALMMIRSSLARINGAALALSKSGGGLVANQSVSPVVFTQVATLKYTYGEKYPHYPEPFPYWEKQYNTYHMFWDHTSWRLGENSKIVTVEGSPAVGKRDFAQKLAKNFDLKYIPPVTDADVYVKQENGVDCRIFNEILPLSACFYDQKCFSEDPHPKKTGRIALYQYYIYRAKFMRYLAALRHVLNTGQGCVLVNSVFTDECYMETFRELGFFKPTFPKAYRFQKDSTLPELYKPHLVIYLDAPAPTIQERMKARNDPVEMNNKVYTPQYFQTLEKHFKRQLDGLRRTCEVMELDWEEPADEMEMDWISAEIQMLRLEAEDTDDPRFQDWYDRSEDEWDALRYISGHPLKPWLWFQNNPHEMNCHEILLEGEDLAIFDRLVRQNPVYKNPRGESQLLDNPLLKFL